MSPMAGLAACREDDMTDTTASLAFEPSFASGEWRRKLTTTFTARKPHRAASPMLELSWSNLDVRLRMIDEAALQTESQKRTYQAVEDLVGEGNSKIGGTALDWDDVHQDARGPPLAPALVCASGES